MHTTSYQSAIMYIQCTLLNSTEPELSCATDSMGLSVFIQKSDVHLADMQSYRRITTCRSSKLLDHLMACQLLDYVNKSGLLRWRQSSYRIGHSTETTVSKVLSRRTAHHRRWRLIGTCVAGSVCSLWHSGSQHFDSVLEHVLRSVWNGAAVLLDVPGWPVPVRSNRFLNISSNSHRMWCTTGVRSWPSCSFCTPSVTTDLILLNWAHGIGPHLYADDTQICGSCRPSVSLEL